MPLLKQHALSYDTAHYKYTLTQCPHVKNICVGLAFIWVLKLGVADEDGVHIAAGILVQLFVAGDHDDGDLHIAEDA